MIFPNDSSKVESASCKNSVLFTVQFLVLIWAPWWYRGPSLHVGSISSDNMFAMACPPKTNQAMV